MSILQRIMLIEIIKEYGISVTEDIQKFEELLSEYCPGCGSNINYLVSAVDSNIVKELMEFNKSSPINYFVNMLSMRLMSNIGISEEHARWAVISWALALGKISGPEAASLESFRSRKEARAPAKDTKIKPLLISTAVILCISVIGIIVFISLKGSRNTTSIDDKKNTIIQQSMPSNSINNITPPSSMDNPSPKAQENNAVIKPTPIKVSIAGNSTANINNGGYAVFSGGYIYFLSAGLYSIKPDGTDRKKLTNDTATSINVVGEWIYYRNCSDNNKVYRIKTDGTDRTCVLEDNCNNFIVVDNVIYYTSNSKNHSLCKVNADGTGMKTLNNGFSQHLNVLNDRIYYYNYQEQKIFRISSDGTQNTMIASQCGANLYIYNNLIYYSGCSDQKLYSIDLNGLNKKGIGEDEKCSRFNISDGWIYYSNVNDKKSLYKIKTDGTGKKKLANGYVNNINIAGEYIYYHDANSKLYNIKTDGSGKQLVE